MKKTLLGSLAVFLLYGAGLSIMFLPHRQAGQSALRLASLPAYGAKTPVRGQSLNVVEGNTCALIVVESDTGATARLKAAQELQEYILKITGREIPIVWEGKGIFQRGEKGWTLKAPQVAPLQGQPEIHIGWTSRALKEVDRSKVEKLDIDGFLIRATPEAP